MIIPRNIFHLLLLCLLLSCSAPQSNSDLIYLRKLKDQAFSGDKESQYQLGIHYSTKGKWRWDKKRGYGWLLDAARAGHADAQYMVGMNNYLGLGTQKDFTKAAAWLERAANQGHERSQYQLGQIYLNGSGVEKDPSWGRYWLEQAAWAGHPDAQLYLAALFMKGIGGQKNLAESWNWLKRAEKNGHKSAQKALQNLAPSIGEQERNAGDRLTQKTGATDAGGLFRTPKIRYLQTILNNTGDNAGREDGETGPRTAAAIQSYQQKNKMPRNTNIDQLIARLRGNSL